MEKNINVILIGPRAKKPFAVKNVMVNGSVINRLVSKKSQLDLKGFVLLSVAIISTLVVVFVASTIWIGIMNPKEQKPTQKRIL